MPECCQFLVNAIEEGLIINDGAEGWMDQDGYQVEVCPYCGEFLP